MKKVYHLPIMGKVLNDKPLTGDKDNPLCLIPLDKLEGFDPDIHGCAITCGEYNLEEEWCEVELEGDEAVHAWLASLLPQLQNIKRAQGWELDKAELSPGRTIEK